MDPAELLSPRDRSILTALGARFVCVNGASKEPTLQMESVDPGFLDWAKRHRVRGVLVRPDRFIAERLIRGAI